MTNERIKEILLDIKDTKLDFTVTQSGKASKKVNGLYYPNTHEIILHNKNFTNDNELIYTAIHEYTHHKATENLIDLMGVSSIYNAKVHTAKFWISFNELLTIAEKKGYYKLSITEYPDLQELTVKIKTEYLEKNGELMKEFAALLSKAFTLCTEHGIRYEDYIERTLLLSRTSARDIRGLANLPISPKVGFDNMKVLSKVDDDELRNKAQDALLHGASPITVRDMLKKPKEVDEEDKRERLEKEKNRIERAIDSLNKRLQIIEEAIDNL